MIIWFLDNSVFSSCFCITLKWLEEAVLIGPGCQLTAGCRIGACALIGAGAVVLGGARVGRHSIIGAGATVVSEIPDYVLALGTPARIERQLPRDR